MDAQTEERKLLEEYISAYDKSSLLDSQAKEAEKELHMAKTRLVEYMEANHTKSTAKYDGIGYVNMNKPILYASCKAENREELFKQLEGMGRQDLIKPAIHPSTLSAFVSECIEQGVKIPEMVTYYLKPSVTLHKGKIT